MKNSKLEKIVYSTSIFLTMWLIISYFDIIANNTNGCNYHFWNLIAMFIQ